MRISSGSWKTKYEILKMKRQVMKEGKKKNRKPKDFLNIVEKYEEKHWLNRRKVYKHKGGKRKEKHKPNKFEAEMEERKKEIEEKCVKKSKQKNRHATKKTIKLYSFSIVCCVCSECELPWLYTSSSLFLSEATLDITNLFPEIIQIH